MAKDDKMSVLARDLLKAASETEDYCHCPDCGYPESVRDSAEAYPELAEEQGEPLKGGVVIVCPICKDEREGKDEEYLTMEEEEGLYDNEDGEPEYIEDEGY